MNIFSQILEEILVLPVMLVISLFPLVIALLLKKHSWSKYILWASAAFAIVVISYLIFGINWNVGNLGEIIVAVSTILSIIGFWVLGFRSYSRKSKEI